MLHTYIHTYFNESYLPSDYTHSKITHAALQRRQPNQFPPTLRSPFTFFGLRAPS